MRKFRALLAVLLALAVLSPPAHTQSPTGAQQQLVQLRHWNGQPVSPAFEGYDVNSDGSFNMWFGYLNRNYEEEPDIPVGPENSFSPGPADRGQPTHFQIRRHKD